MHSSRPATVPPTRRPTDVRKTSDSQISHAIPPMHTSCFEMQSLKFQAFHGFIDCRRQGIACEIAERQGPTLLASHSDRRRRCGGRRRGRRARAGFEIDHSEPQARVWRSRGRPGPTAPGTPAEPQATSSIANAACAAGADDERAGRPRGGRRSGGATSNTQKVRTPRSTPGSGRPGGRRGGRAR